MILITGILYDIPLIHFALRERIKIHILRKEPLLKDIRYVLEICRVVFQRIYLYTVHITFHHSVLVRNPTSVLNPTNDGFHKLIQWHARVL